MLWRSLGFLRWKDICQHGELPGDLSITRCHIEQRALDYSLEPSELIQQLACYDLRHLIFCFSGRLGFINDRTSVHVLEVWAEIKRYSVICPMLEFLDREV